MPPTDGTVFAGCCKVIVLAMPQLDILGSSVSEVTTAPCSAAAPCYQVTMQLIKYRPESLATPL